MVAHSNGQWHAIIFCSCVCFLLFSFFFLTYSQQSEIECLPYFYTCRGLSANLDCRSEMCCTRLAENSGCTKAPKIRHMGTIAQLRRDVSSQLRHVSTIRKKMVRHCGLTNFFPIVDTCLSCNISNISSTYPHNMANFGLLTAGFGSGVCSTPANFNGFHVLPSLLLQRHSPEAFFRGDTPDWISGCGDPIPHPPSTLSFQLCTGASAPGAGTQTVML